MEGQQIQANVQAELVRPNTAPPPASHAAAGTSAAASSSRPVDTNGVETSFAVGREPMQAEVDFFSLGWEGREAWCKGVEDGGPAQHVELYNTSPIVDLLQGTQDRLFCKLFSS